MTDLVQSLFRIDPTQGLVDYVNAVKPYHTKLLEVLVEYVYTERVDITVGERWKWNMAFTRPDSEIVYTCGYGVRWDPYGITAPESTPTSLIVNATGKLFVDVTTAAGSSNITIIRNVTGHPLSVDDSITFDFDGIPPVELTPGTTYYITSVASNVISVSGSVGGSPVVFSGSSVLRIAPQGLPYSTFLVQPALNTTTYTALATSTATGQLAFVDGYNLTDVDTVANAWSVKPWTPGSGYTPGTFTNISLVGGSGAGTDTLATVTVDSLGTVSNVIITTLGTKTYTRGDVLTTTAFLSGAGFTFIAPNSSLNLPLTPGEVIYVNGNTSPIANGRYTVASVSGWDVSVNEDIPPLTNASGTLYTTDVFDQIPYWASGSKVKVTTTGTLPTPLSDSLTYYFIPSNQIGVFNLATKRYPEHWDDYVDLTAIGTELQIERVEPFVPGDYVTVSGSYMHHNDGRYIVSTIVPEGAYFRIGVGQSIKSTTPTPAPANDGVMMLDAGTYDMPLHCPAVKTPDLYAGAYIHENLQFTFTITEQDFIGATTVENEVGGWGTDLFGTTISLYGSGSEKLPPYTAMTDGVNTTSGTHTILPTGYDTQIFDFGSIDEDLWSMKHIHTLPTDYLNGQW